MHAEDRGALDEGFQQAQTALEGHEAVVTGGTKLLFGVIFVTNFMINLDHGILPAATEQVRDDLGLSNLNLGILGSLVYLGLVIGNPSFKSRFIAGHASVPFFQHEVRAHTLLDTQLLLPPAFHPQRQLLYLKYVSTPSWSLPSNLAPFDRQVFFCIYFPVWVDLFADEKHKTLWLTTLLLGVPLGVVSGYIITALLVVYVNVSALTD